MKAPTALALALLSQAASAHFVLESENSPAVPLYTDWAKEGVSTTEGPRYHIELSPGETRWVTEEEKWALRRVSSLASRF